jgi:hypothetical protein
MRKSSGLLHNLDTNTGLCHLHAQPHLRRHLPNISAQVVHLLHRCRDEARLAFFRGTFRWKPVA